MIEGVHGDEYRSLTKAEVERAGPCPRRGTPMQVTGHIDFSITSHSKDEVTGEMPLQTGILNPFGVAHAGAILWFADVCATILAFGGVDFAEGAAGFPLAINLNAALLGNQKNGVLTATSSFVKRGRQLTVVRTKVTGEGGRLIAEVTTSHLAKDLAHMRKGPSAGAGGAAGGRSGG